MLSDIAFGLAAFLALAAVTAVCMWLIASVAASLATGVSVRRNLVGDANRIIYSLSRTLRIDLPQFDARTKAQRAEDDAFMALAATYHREQ